MRTGITRARIAKVLRVSTISLLSVDAATMAFWPTALASEFAITGFAPTQAPALAAILAAAILLYTVPRTAIIGAICITGFLGGAISAHFRLGEIGSPPQWICLILGMIAWGGTAASASVRPWLDRPAPPARQ